VRLGGRHPPFPDPELIRTLATLLTETGLTEIEYAIGDRRIRVARVPSTAGPAAVPAAPSAAAPPFPLPVSTPGDYPGAVKAPMVGTVYLAPQPGDPPFVRLGDSVAEGQPLLIIEAMKVMNQIRAHRSGRVAEILVADAQPVEYGAVLMLIE
jgi:acetyl-CoA carboxylase biotin carboxyl carrier protein